MSTVSTLPIEHVRELAAQAFARARPQWTKPELIVLATQNFDGDDSLYVTAVFPDDVSRPNGPQQIDFQIELGKLLMAQGDYRLVYLSALNESELGELKRLQNEDLPDDA